MFENGQTSSDLEAPMWIVYLAVPLGSYLMCFRFLQVARSFARTGKVPHTNEAHVEGLDKVAPIIPAERQASAKPAQGGAR
jgi:TRAP-type C4-dicarboxylate transport system permease small subunit